MRFRNWILATVCAASLGARGCQSSSQSIYLSDVAAIIQKGQRRYDESAQKAGPLSEDDRVRLESKKREAIDRLSAAGFLRPGENTALLNADVSTFYHAYEASAGRTITDYIP